MDSKIIAFLQKHHILALAVCDKEGPYAASCFYAFDESRFALLFASDPATRHMRAIFSDEGRAAAAIHHDTKRVGVVRGAQIKGICEAADEEQRRLYLARFPYAAAMDPAVWALRIEWLKYTDNRLGFGKKLIWTRRR